MVAKNRRSDVIYLDPYILILREKPLFTIGLIGQYRTHLNIKYSKERVKIQNNTGLSERNFLLVFLKYKRAKGRFFVEL